MPIQFPSSLTISRALTVYNDRFDLVDKYVRGSLKKESPSTERRLFLDVVDKCI